MPAGNNHTIRHIIIARIFCFQNYFPIKARNITHKITPALLTNTFQELFSLARNLVFHEIFESQNYTLWGLHTRIFWGNQYWAALHNIQKNPRAHKSKIGTPPLPQNPKYPPPLNEEFYGHGFFLQKERIFPGVHKIGAAISGPRIADKNFTDTRIFLK